MWRSRRSRKNESVTCIACGSSVSRSDAREYDKHGDRWDREGKEFEYLCKECHRELCHQPRDELEPLLVEVETDGQTQTEFLAAYCAVVEERYGSAEER